MKQKKRTTIEMYPHCYIYKGKRTFLVWRTRKDEPDTFKLDSNNRLVSAKSEQELRNLLGNDSEQLRRSESTTIDLDKFWRALRNLKAGTSSSTKTCTILLDGWNFIEDLLRTVGLTQEIKKLHFPVLNKVYRKLFHGCNLPSITPEGKSYNPIWLQEEISLLRKEIHSIWKKLRESGYIGHSRRVKET
jgi:hypothetical protein